MSRTPMIAPAIVPTPPNKLTPPTTVPAITVSSQPPPILGEPADKVAITSIPESAESVPAKIKQFI